MLSIEHASAQILNPPIAIKCWVSWLITTYHCVLLTFWIIRTFWALRKGLKTSGNSTKDSLLLETRARRTTGAKVYQLFTNLTVQLKRKYTLLEQWLTLWRGSSDVEWKVGIWMYPLVLSYVLVYIIAHKLLSKYPDKELLFSSECYDSFLSDFTLWRGRGL